MTKPALAQVPEFLPEVDLLRAQLASERVVRAVAQLEMEKARFEAVRVELSSRLKLAAEDTMDLGTGLITRGVKA